MLDILFVSVPVTFELRPPAAPALLQSAVEAHGFSSKYIDFNLRFFRDKFNNHSELEFFFLETPDTVPLLPQAEKIIQGYAEELVKLNPKWVGISIFTYQNRTASKLFCKAIKQLNQNIKIVLGGSGLSHGGIGGKQDFADKLISQKLADFWIRSEGELAIVELLKGNYSYPGINTHDYYQIKDLDSLPFPTYKDYILDSYDQKTLPVTSSRGCVRSCSFCDIHEHWKYSYRSGEKVAQELIENSKKYNIDFFAFTDSLVNGNLKEFKIFCKTLAEYHLTTENKIRWGGQFIVRNEKILNEDFWKNLKLAGGESFAIGVETGSDRVRAHMQKNFTNVDLDYTMRMLEKYSITCDFLIIVGYPTETKEDFQDTLDMFKKYQHLAGNIIVNVNTGPTLAILPNTPLYDSAHRYNIELDEFENNWMANDNPELTLRERIDRLKYLETYLIELGYNPSMLGKNFIENLEKNLERFNTRNKVKKIIKLKEVKRSL